MWDGNPTTYAEVIILPLTSRGGRTRGKVAKSRRATSFKPTCIYTVVKGTFNYSEFIMNSSYFDSCILFSSMNRSKKNCMWRVPRGEVALYLQALRSNFIVAKSK